MERLRSSYKYKFILLGDLGVGKTSYFKRLEYDSFDENLTDNSVTEFLEYQQNVDGTIVKVFLYDTGGMERGGSTKVTGNYYRDSAAVLLFYSLDSMYTLQNLEEWVKCAQENFGLTESAITWALIGTKNDLPDGLTESEVQTFCEGRLNVQLLFFVSAKSGENVKSSFEAIITAVHRKQHLVIQTETKGNSSIKLHRTSRSKNDGNCAC